VHVDLRRDCRHLGRPRRACARRSSCP
jgi:hypothetical protein